MRILSIPDKPVSHANLICPKTVRSTFSYPASPNTRLGDGRRFPGSASARPRKHQHHKGEDQARPSQSIVGHSSGGPTVYISSFCVSCSLRFPFPSEARCHQMCLIQFDSFPFENTRPRHQTLDARHQTLDARHLTLDIRHQTPDTRHQTPDTRH
jgi:hypothetical protein